MFDSSLHFAAVTLQNELNGKSLQVNALLDSGADRNSLDIEVARSLNLDGKKVSFAMTGLWRRNHQL